LKSNERALNKFFIGDYESKSNSKSDRDVYGHKIKLKKNAGRRNLSKKNTFYCTPLRGQRNGHFDGFHHFVRKEEQKKKRKYAHTAQRVLGNTCTGRKGIR